MRRGRDYRGSFAAAERWFQSCCWPRKTPRGSHFLTGDKPLVLRGAQARRQAMAEATPTRPAVVSGLLVTAARRPRARRRQGGCTHGGGSRDGDTTAIGT